jgi:hypothetical protein
MDDNSAPNIIKALDDEWETLGTSRMYREALAHWCEAEEVLAGFASPADVVKRAERRGDPAGANELIGALLRLAGDPLAARTLLQALLPGLASRAARGAWAARASRRCAPACEGLDELDQEVVASAWERIVTLAGTSPEWPACVLVEGAWRRVRQRAETARARSCRSVPLAGAARVEVNLERPAPEALTVHLVDEVRRGRLRPADAGLVYTTRVLGHSPAELAPCLGVDARALRARRARIEGRLVGH